MQRDTGDAATRRPEGSRHFLTGAATGWLSRAIAILTGIATLPIALDAYGPALYGVWITTTSLTQYLNNGSLGMPLAVMTGVASAPDRDAAARVGAHGARIALGGAAAIIAVGALAWVVFPTWPISLFGDEGRLADVVTAVVIALVGSAAMLPLQVYANVQAGRHRIVARNAYDTARTVSRFVALLVAVRWSDSLLTLSAITIGGEFAVAIVRAVHITVSERIPLHRHIFDRSVREEGLLGSGLRYMVLQIESTIIRNTDNIVISSLIGTAAVSIYAAPSRLFLAATAVIESVGGTLWPAYGTARRDEDWEWIDRVHKRVLQLALGLGGAVWVGTTGFAGPVIRLWLGPDFPVDPWVVFALGGYTFIASWVTANSVLLKALDATRTQIMSDGAEAVVNVALSIALASTLGPAGVAAGSAIGALVVSPWILPADVRRQSDGRVEPHLSYLVKAAAVTAPLACATLWAVLRLSGSQRFGFAVAATCVHLAAMAFIFRADLIGFRRPPSRTGGSGR